MLAKRSILAGREAPLEAQVFAGDSRRKSLRSLETLLEPRSYEKGAPICRAGEPATGLFFILSGQVSVVVRLDHRRTGRITTLSAGSAFGEMAMLDHGVRSADVIADTAISCLFLGFESLEKDRSEILTRIRLKLITNIGRVLSQKLRQATVEIKSLKS